MMDLWDAGQPMERIAETLGKTRAHVSTIVTRYGTINEARLHAANAEIGSAMLAAAINQIFKFQPRERASAE